MLVIGLLIAFLARPQSTNRWENETVEGIDIMLTLDISGSMLAGDFSPNRIEASKDVASEFVSGRPMTGSDWCCSAEKALPSARLQQIMLC